MEDELLLHVMKQKAVFTSSDNNSNDTDSNIRMNEDDEVNN
jgi:hypothetical protein